jgi:hypothetical protein
MTCPKSSTVMSSKAFSIGFPSSDATFDFPQRCRSAAHDLVAGQS